MLSLFFVYPIFLWKYKTIQITEPIIILFGIQFCNSWTSNKRVLIGTRSSQAKCHLESQLVLMACSTFVFNTHKGSKFNDWPDFVWPADTWYQIYNFIFKASSNSRKDERKMIPAINAYIKLLEANMNSAQSKVGFGRYKRYGYGRINLDKDMPSQIGWESYKRSSTPSLDSLETIIRSLDEANSKYQLFSYE